MVPWKRTTLITLGCFITTPFHQWQQSQSLSLFASAFSTVNTGNGNTRRNNSKNNNNNNNNNNNKSNKNHYSQKNSSNPPARKKRTDNNENHNFSKSTTSIGNRSKHRNKYNQNNNQNGRENQQKSSSMSSSSSSSNQQQQQQDILAPPPPLTNKNDQLLPFYFSCRHTYEDALMEEIQRSIQQRQSKNDNKKHHHNDDDDDDDYTFSISSPSPGLVRVMTAKKTKTIKSKNENNSNHNNNSKNPNEILQTLDPVYALQVLPNCHIIQAESIKQLALSALSSLGLDESPSSTTTTTTLEPEPESLSSATATTTTTTTATTLSLAQQLRNAPRGSLAIHTLVPGMFKGQRDPILKRRAEKIGEQLVTLLKKGYPCARKNQQNSNNHNDNENNHKNNNDTSDVSNEKWVLQVLLFSPEVIGVSLSKCQPPPPQQQQQQQQQQGTAFLGDWPNWKYPAGLAKVDIEEETMPSSAYRKLLEALECQGITPPSSSSSLFMTLSSNDNEEEEEDIPAVVDLGACPGGWTKALRLLGCKVIAVDRSELREDLMKDEMVQFVKADAFTYEPPRIVNLAQGKRQRQQQNGHYDNDNDSSLATTTTNTNTVIPKKNTWMVSDVIAYPERVAELLDRWCGGKWAEHMIVTVKFQGETIPWNALETAIQVATTKHGYACRTKHFFNNKNEVTMMISYPHNHNGHHDHDHDGMNNVLLLKNNNNKAKGQVPRILGKPLYQPAL